MSGELILIVEDNEKNRKLRANPITKTIPVIAITASAMTYNNMLDC